MSKKKKIIYYVNRRQLMSTKEAIKWRLRQFSSKIFEILKNVKIQSDLDFNDSEGKVDLVRKIKISILRSIIISQQLTAKENVMPLGKDMFHVAVIK